MSSPSFSPCAFSSFINGGGESKIEFEISLPKTREDRELDRGRGGKKKGTEKKETDKLSITFFRRLFHERIKSFTPTPNPPKKSFESEIAPLRGGKGVEATCASLRPPFSRAFLRAEGRLGFRLRFSSPGRYFGQSNVSFTYGHTV